MLPKLSGSNDSYAPTTSAGSPDSRPRALPRREGRDGATYSRDEPRGEPFAASGVRALFACLRWTARRGKLSDTVLLLKPLHARRAAMLREEIRAEGMNARRALALGNALERAGKLLDAIEALTTANALRPDHGVERRLVRLRRRAFAELVRSRTPGPAVPVVAAYLGERPALSVEKCALRRADASLHPSTWHQDGAFLGLGIRTLDVWLALSPCGRDAPGLDVIPLRLDRVLPTGEPGTFFEWTVAQETIARELPDATPWRPAFEEGDALLFDHLLIHRTAADPAMPHVRYAIESWFFAPSTYPRTSTPLIV